MIDSRESAYEKKGRLYFVVFIAARVAAWLSAMKKALYRRVGRKPKCNSLLFDGAGPQCRAVKEGATSWKALHVLYCGPFEHLADKFWLLGLLNARGVRNRLRAVVANLTKELQLVLSRKETVTIVSLACGSAEAVVQAISSLGEDKSRVRLILLDMAEDALDYAREECRRAGIEVTTIKSNIMRMVVSVNRNIRSEKLATVTDLLGQVDIVEMVGLMDYLEDGVATELFRAVRELLAPTGLFITANAMPNGEIPFLHYCSDWDMVYRHEGELRLLCSRIFRAEVQPEPLRTHAIAKCRKL